MQNRVLGLLFGYCMEFFGFSGKMVVFPMRISSGKLVICYTKWDCPFLHSQSICILTVWHCIIILWLLRIIGIAPNLKLGLGHYLLSNILVVFCTAADKIVSTVPLLLSGNRSHYCRNNIPNLVKDQPQNSTWVLSSIWQEEFGPDVVIHRRWRCKERLAEVLCCRERPKHQAHQMFCLCFCSAFVHSSVVC